MDVDSNDSNSQSMNGNLKKSKIAENNDNSIALTTYSNTDDSNNDNESQQSPSKSTANGSASQDTNSNDADSSTNTNKIRKIRKIGYDDAGSLMPGFEDVNDDQMAFSSESDFAIFIKQISSEIPLQRLVAVKRMIKSCHLWGEEAVLSVLPRVKQLSCDKEMVIRQAIAEVLGPFAKYLVETMSDNVYVHDNETNSNHDMSVNGNDESANNVDKEGSNDNETKQENEGDGKPTNQAINGQDRAYKVIVDELLPLIKEMLKDAMEVRQGAGSSLIIIAELLNKEQVYEHILKIVLHMAHDDSDDQKITALPLLGDLAPIVGSAVCKNYLSADLHALSQDNSFRVRKATVQYFGPICEQLGNTDAEECLLPIFLSLCSDSIWSVRKGCVESFVDVSSSISSASRIKLIPIMEKFLNDSSRWVRNTAYEVLGPFISSLSSEQISADFLKYFTSIPHLSSAEADADCTNHCAFNFPAVVLTVGKERWNELNDTYNILCRKTFKSRKTLACSIHEIANVLGEELTEKYLLNSIEFFLKDIDDIRQGIIKNLWKILKVFNNKLRVEYISILWELASESDVNWRFRLLLAQQLDEILYLYNKKIIKQQIIPLIFQLCQDRMADVRYAAVYPIADAVNILSSPTATPSASSTAKEDEEQNDDENSNDQSNEENDDSDDDLQCVIKKVQTIYKGRTYSKRLLYIRIADSCFSRISNELFDQIFLNDLLNYANDKIFNVRFCLARFISKHLLHDAKYNTRDVVIKAIDILRNDEEDVEVKRFFMQEDDVEEWLQLRRQRESQQDMEQQRSNGTNNNTLNGSNDEETKGNNGRSAHSQSKSKDSDGLEDSTDSSLYSSSDSDNENLEDEDLDDEDDDDYDTNDKLKSVSDQLKSIDDNLNNKKLENMDLSTIGTNELSEEQIAAQTDGNNLDDMHQGLIHQDTPFELDIPKDLAQEAKDAEDEDKKKQKGNYGLPVETEASEEQTAEQADEEQAEPENEKAEAAEPKEEAAEEQVNADENSNSNEDKNDESEKAETQSEDNEENTDNGGNIENTDSGNENV
eukprot:CAMPEP_0197040808 /NCGR_PEP_ID=MMETSP1384-20130603/17458_1 /TAXON_ID=29189 /ORGANISM="Ammonia sp." /LENGTH=1050 /DNA_ID=CAMNT_0042471633 /DNA_START=91 /DNA_END=3243 /DNA_ORIENTATION=-